MRIVGQRDRLCIVGTQDDAIMATPELQNAQRPDSSVEPPAADAPETSQQMTVATSGSLLADYRPSWWILPAMSLALLSAVLVIYLGLRYEQDAVVWCGVALFVLVTGTLAVSSIRYSWLLVRDLSDWRRSGKRVYKM